MKPSWDDAPSWAQWLAMDGDGWWGWYEVEPVWDEGEGQWIIDLAEDDDEPEYESVSGGPDESGIDWDFAYSTLEHRP